MTEDEMVGWHHRLNDSMDMSLGKLRVGDEQGGLVYCSPWGRNLDMQMGIIEHITGIE